jgi:type I restriction enzyme S subunit
MLDLNVIKNFSLDKKSWKKVKLGDVVFEPKESVKDPIAEGIEHVVGLEHINSEDIHLRRSANIKESTTFTKKFKKGDVLFGRRRAYLKKAAKAHFEGICSGDITVMRAKEELLLPELLPFLINNDKFFDFAITHSAGGLSPRVKFKDLANYELSLPSTKKQLELVVLFNQKDNYLQYQNSLLEKLQTLKNATLKSIYNHSSTPKNPSDVSSEIGYIPEGWAIEEQGSVVKFINGRAYKKTEWEEEGTPVIRLQNLTGTGEKYYYSKLDLPDKNYCDSGDLLYMWSATFGAIIWEGSRAIFHYHIWKIECDESKILKKFMFYNLEEITRRMMKQASGSTMPHITKEGMGKLKIALPTISKQVEFVSKLDKIMENINNTKSNISLFKKLSNNMIEQVF